MVSKTPDWYRQRSIGARFDAPPNRGREYRNRQRAEMIADINAVSIIVTHDGDLDAAMIHLLDETFLAMRARLAAMAITLERDDDAR